VWTAQSDEPDGQQIVSRGERHAVTVPRLVRMSSIRPSVGSYLRQLLRPFFWPWWALFTGVASAASWLGVPIAGFHVPGWVVGIFVCATFAGAFLLASVAWQGWRLYRDSLSRIALVGIQTSTAYDGEHVVLLTCGVLLPDGTLLELSRTDNGVEIPIGLLEIKGTNSREELQAHPIWFGVGHLNELMKNTLSLQSVRASTIISTRAVRKASDEWAQTKVPKP
jgi:hypothetical protein